MSLPVYRWFRYSAGFSADWAESVIREHEAERALDPFGGSGTSILAVQSCGAEGIAVDVHPFVARVANAKLAWNADRDEFRSWAETALDVAEATVADISDAVPLSRKVFPPTP